MRVRARHRFAVLHVQRTRCPNFASVQKTMSISSQLFTILICNLKETLIERELNLKLKEKLIKNFFESLIIRLVI